MTYAPLVTIGFSTILIICLCLGDPKRRRAARIGGAAQRNTVRRTIAAIACLPGVYFALNGDPAAFLNWLGGCGVLGWFVTLAAGTFGRDSR
jgi:hypothetical protein